MALTFTKTGETLIGNRWFVYGTVAFDSSYPTGGEAISLEADLDLRKLEFLAVVGTGPAAAGYQATWDGSKTAPKLLALYGDYNNAADGPLIEVPNATNIATVTGVPIFAIGTR